VPGTLGIVDNTVLVAGDWRKMRKKSISNSTSRVIGTLAEKLWEKMRKGKKNTRVVLDFYSKIEKVPVTPRNRGKGLRQC